MPIHTAEATLEITIERILLTGQHELSDAVDELQQRYQGNLFSAVRQLCYLPKEDKRQTKLDMALFLNGLLLFTAKLKNSLAQNFTDALRQYRHDRNTRDHRFQLGRCLTHFALDSQLGYFATHLDGGKTRSFLSNKGYNNGAGSPPVQELSACFANCYLWEEIWSRDSILNVARQFARFYEVQDGIKPTEDNKVALRYWHAKLAGDAQMKRRFFDWLF